MREKTYRNVLSKVINGTSGLHLKTDCGLDGWFSNFYVFWTFLVDLSKQRLPDATPPESLIQYGWGRVPK